MTLVGKLLSKVQEKLEHMRQTGNKTAEHVEGSGLLLRCRLSGMVLRGLLPQEENPEPSLESMRDGLLR